jgi:hypothetical protein
MTMPDTFHTPGPWEACDPGDYGDFDGESRVILGDDMRIAVVHWSPRLNTSQSDANARLIAAAPDLLLAVIELEARFGHVHCYPIDLARAALSSALGEG